MDHYAVGSRTIAEYLDRPVGVDYDFICTTDYAERIKRQSDQILVDKPGKLACKIRNCIFEYDYKSTSEKLLRILEKTPASAVDLNYTLKMSHRYLKNSPHFLKTMRDIHSLRKHGAKIPDVLKDWFVERERETYNYSKPDLSQNKANFFKDAYEYDHDSIHVAIALFDRPAYTYYKDDQKEVWCSRKLFNQQPMEIKLAGVYEESCVLALERCLIPYKFRPTPEFAFFKALEKVCTSITTGFFREFAWEHYHAVGKIHRDNPSRFVDKFNEGLAKGVVKRNV